MPEALMPPELGPYIGYPRIKPPKMLLQENLRPPDVASQFTRGLFGENSFDEPMSVLDPQAERLNNARDLGWGAAQALNIAPFLGAVAKAKGVATGGRQTQRGAILLGGHPDTVITHSGAYLPDNLESIRENGLFAPSLGITKAASNPYNKAAPQLVFRAGALDRHFPEEAPAGLWNRDAYTWNPSRFNAVPIKQQWERMMASPEGLLGPKLANISGDARLTQMMPDHGAQAAAIIGSPNFKNLKEWEESPFGLGALRGNYGVELEKYSKAFHDLMTEHGAAPGDILRQLSLVSGGKVSHELIQGSPLAEMFSLARKAPSEMAEYKIYAPSVPAGPEHASIFAPSRHLLSPNVQEQIAEQGYQLYDPRHLAGMTGDRELAEKVAGEGVTNWRENPIHLLAPPTGQAPMPANEAMRRYKDLLPPKIEGRGWDVPKIEGAPLGVEQAGPKINPLKAWASAFDKKPDTYGSTQSPMTGTGPSLDLLKAMERPDWYPPSMDEFSDGKGVTHGLMNYLNIGKEEADTIFMHWLNDLSKDSSIAKSIKQHILQNYTEVP